MDKKKTQKLPKAKSMNFKAVLSTFYDGLQNKNIDTVKMVLNAYPQILRIHDNNGHNAFHHLAINVELMWAWELLVAHDQKSNGPLYARCARNTRNEHHQVHYAAKYGNVAFLSQMKALDEHALSEVSVCHDNILHVATRFNQVECVHYILQACPDLCEHENANGYIPLQEAIIDNNIEMIELLLTAQMDFYRFGILKQNDILRQINAKTMKVILKKCPDAVNELETHGYNVLCGASTVEVVRYLLTYKPELIDFVDNYGNTLLHYFACWRDIEFVNLILDVKPGLIGKTNNNNDTALYCAHALSKYDAITCIAARCSNMNYDDKYHNTLLHLVVQSASTELIANVYNHKPTNIFIKNIYGQTPFSIFVQYFQNNETQNFFESVLEIGFIVDTYRACNVNLSTLQLKIEEQCDEELKLLPELNDIVFDARTFYNEITNVKKKSMVAYLFSVFYFFKKKNSTHSKKKKKSICDNNTKKKNMTSDDVDQPLLTKNVLSSFYDDLENKNVENVKMTLNMYPHILRRHNKNGFHVFCHLAVTIQSMWAWELLITYDQKLNGSLYLRCMPDILCGYYPVHFAAMRGNITFLSQTKTLDKHALFALTRQCSENILHIAARYNQLECAYCILQSCPGLYEQESWDGSIPLDEAIVTNNVQIIELLLSMQMDLSKYKISKHYNILRRLNSACLKLMFDTFPETIKELETDGYHVLCTAPNIETVRYLLTYKPELIDSVDGLGNTLLHYFVIHRDVEFVDLVLDVKSELIGKTNNNNDTALYCAHALSKYEAIECMVARCPNMNYNDNYHNTLLHLVAQSASTELIESVYNHNPVNIFAKNIYGQTPFSIIVQCNNNKCAQDFFESILELEFIINTYRAHNRKLSTLQLKVVEQFHDINILPELHGIVFEYIGFEQTTKRNTKFKKHGSV